MNKGEIPAGLIYGDQNRDASGLELAADAQLTPHRPDGSVSGSYDAETMQQLLHYHDRMVPGVGNTALTGGYVELGGERFDA